VGTQEGVVAGRGGRRVCLGSELQTGQERTADRESCLEREGSWPGPRPLRAGLGSVQIAGAVAGQRG
jgi:hypothetical protein